MQARPPRRSSCRSGSLRWRSAPRGLLLAAALLALAAAGCECFPNDPEDSLAKALERGTLRIGLSEAPPWVTRDGERPGGVEVVLLASFARELGVVPEWRWGPVEEHVMALERYELDVVAAGATRENPWSRRAGATRPYYRKHLLLVPPGENALLLRLEARLRRPPSEIAALLAREGSP